MNGHKSSCEQVCSDVGRQDSRRLVGARVVKVAACSIAGESARSEKFH